MTHVSRTRPIRAAALLGLLTLAGVTLLWILWVPGYSGDGVFTDGGLLAVRPRYEIRFPHVSLAKPGEYLFTSNGLPSVPLTLTLELADLHEHDDEMRAFFRQYPNKKWPGVRERDRYDEIKRSRTWIQATWSTDGQPVAATAGTVKDSWVLAWVAAVNSGELWHPNCRDIRFNPGRTYTLSLTIKDVDADAPPLTVVPVLSGGGMELP